MLETFITEETISDSNQNESVVVSEQILEVVLPVQEPIALELTTKEKQNLVQDLRAQLDETFKFDGGFLTRYHSVKHLLLARRLTYLPLLNAQEVVSKIKVLAFYGNEKDKTQLKQEFDNLLDSCEYDKVS